MIDHKEWLLELDLVFNVTITVMVYATALSVNTHMISKS